MNENDLIERQLDSRLIFDGRILHVYDDAVTLPNGGVASRELIRHIGAVCVIPVLRDGRAVVERQYRYPVGEVLTEIPAGKLDAPDEDPEEAARRELREETGYTCDELIALGVSPGRPGAGRGRIPERDAGSAGGFGASGAERGDPRHQDPGGGSARVDHVNARQRKKGKKRQKGAPTGGRCSTPFALRTEAPDAGVGTEAF